MPGVSKLFASRVHHARPEPLVWHNPPELAESTVRLVAQLCGFDRGHDLTQTRVLDFGCGKGRYMNMFAQYVPLSNIDGCDVDPDSVQATRRRGFRCEQLAVDKAQLPYDDAAFDVVFSSNVIEHIPRPLYLNYLSEISRVLSPGGTFVVGAPNYPAKRLYDMLQAIRSPQYRRYYLLDDPTHCNRQSVIRVERDLRQHFISVRLEGTELFFQRFLPVLRRPSVRHRLRLFANKFIGTCRKA